MNQSQNNQTSNDQKADDFLLAYENSLFKEMGLEFLSETDALVLREKTAQLIHRRLLNTLLIYLPEEKATDLRKKVEGMKPEELIDQLIKDVPNAQEKMAKELTDLKTELVGKEND